MENKIINENKFIVTNFVIKSNMMKGNKTDYDCPKCKNRGFFIVPKITLQDNIRFWECVCIECECEKKRDEIRRINQSGLGKYLNYKIKDFVATKKWQVDLKYKVMDFCLNHCENDNNEKWIAFLGQNGSGKSFMASVVANHLLNNKKREVKCVNWNNFLSKFKKDISGDEYTKENAISDLEELKNADVLFIDEFMQNYNPNVDKKYIDEIIDYRYSNKLKTIITTPKLLNDLLLLNESSISRIYEMCEGSNFTIEIPYNKEDNYRLKGLKK